MKGESYKQLLDHQSDNNDWNKDWHFEDEAQQYDHAPSYYDNPHPPPRKMSKKRKLLPYAVGSVIVLLLFVGLFSAGTDNFSSLTASKSDSSTSSASPQGLELATTLDASDDFDNTLVSNIDKTVKQGSPDSPSYLAQAQEGDDSNVYEAHLASSSSKTTDATTAENDDGDEDVAGQPEEVSFESDYPTIGDALDAADEPQEQDTTADDATESGAEQLDTAAAVENEDSAPVINEDATTSDPLPASSTGESQDPTPNAYPEETEAQADKEVATATDADDVEFIDDTESLTAQQQDESGQEDATPLDAEEAANETPDASAAVEEHTSAEALDVAPEDEDAHEVQGQNGTMEVELEAEGAAQGEDDGTELEVEAEEEEAEVKKVRRTDSHAAAQRMVKVTVRPARVWAH